MYKKITTLFSVLCMMVGFITGCRATPLDIVVDTVSEYFIIIPDDPSGGETRAAEVLQSYIEQISQADIRIIRESAYIPKIKGIYLGRTKRCRPFLNNIRNEGFLIRQEGADILLASNNGRSAEYAVCHFLEKYLGCRKYDQLPVSFEKRNTIKLSDIKEELVNPAFAFRQAYYPMSNDVEYMRWHGLHKFEDLWGLWGHSFFKLVPPKDYFAVHPEYFALVNGVRSTTQLCLSNPEVLDITVNRLKKMIADNPDAEYWSVGPNDEGGYCTCDLCKKADAADGGPAGSLIKFVNKVAVTFPDKKITTLGYGYTAKAPVQTRPAPNVYILVSSIDAFREKPLAEIPSASGFRENLKAWSAITDNIFVWDYATQFTNYLAPFPGQSVLQPNFRFFLQNKVKGIFEQGSGDTYSDMAELNSYLQAKLLWDPSADTKIIIEDFCKGYYGKAAPSVLAYLQKREQALLSSGRHLDIYGSPVADIRGYLSPEYVDAYDQLLEKAEAAVAGSLYEVRVRRIRLSLDYVVLQQSRHFGAEQHGFLGNPNNGYYTIKSIWPQRISHFVAGCKSAGVTELAEGGLSPDEYQADWNKIFARKWSVNPALNAVVTLKNPFVEDYPAKGNRTLTDGMTGFEDFNYNWLCFYGTDMVATIDLGKNTQVAQVRMNFLDDQRHWILAPESVLVEISADGSSFKMFDKILLPALREKNTVSIIPLVLSSKTIAARYIRITALCPKELPSWRSHPVKKPMIACDEVFVLP